LNEKKDEIHKIYPQMIDTPLEVITKREEREKIYSEKPY